MSKGQILVVDDEMAQREILRTILSAEGYRIWAEAIEDRVAKALGER